MNKDKAKDNIDNWAKKYSTEERQEILYRYYLKRFSDLSKQGVLASLNAKPPQLPVEESFLDHYSYTEQELENMKEASSNITEEMDKQVEQEAKDITYSYLEVAVELWAKDKGIIEKATPIKQALKTQEEVLELQNAILDNDREEIQDALGDILVTIIIQAKMQGLELLDCLQSAYDVISKRSGKMVKGQFLKDK